MAGGESPIVNGEFDITIHAGKNLLATDGGIFTKKTSDPYVKVLYLGKKIFETKHLENTLNPKWEASVKLVIPGRQIRMDKELTFAVFDDDALSSDDPMGEVIIPLKSLESGQSRWYPVRACKGCKKAKGELHVSASLVLRRALSLKQRDSVPVTDSVVACCLGWDMADKGRTAIDLDTSCVAVSDKGAILIEECVYFAQLCSRSGAIRHTGDEREGDEDLGSGDDEIIIVDLARVPKNVIALFMVATVATEGRSFADVKSSKMRLVDWTTGTERARYYPATSGAHTALFMCRLARTGSTWSLQTIGGTDHTARDWGTLVPEIKTCVRTSSNLCGAPCRVRA